MRVLNHTKSERHRRDKLDILKDILSTCSDEKALKTHIIYKSNTNHQIATRYISWLLAHEFMRKNEEFYEITPKGYELLNKLNKIALAK